MTGGVTAMVARLAAELGIVIESVPIDGAGRAADRAAGRRAVAAALATAGAPAPVDGHEADGRPRWPAGWTGSIAHGAGWAVAAVAPDRDLIGIDIERSGALALDDARLVLDTSERALATAASDPAALATLLWSAKESAFKAWSTAAGGLAGVDPVDIHIDIDDDAGRIRATAKGALSGRAPLAGRFARCGDVTLTVLLGG